MGSPTSALVRTTRARAIRLRNDLKGVMAKIEPALHEYFAKARESGVEPPPLPAPRSVERRTAGLSAIRDAAAAGRAGAPLALRPFAKVNSVVVGSPADQAGLRAGDEVLRFGDVEWSSEDRLAKVAATTGRSEGVRRSHSPAGQAVVLTICLQREIKVRVLRRAPSGSHAEHLDLSLTPRSDWGGRGLLGCHIIEMQ